MSLKRIIITGHTGFLGYHISRFLNEKKYQVIGISKNKDSCLNFKQIKANLNRFEKISIPEKVFGVIHCAGITNINFCQENPMACFKSNLLGTLKVLEFIKKKRCKMIFFSTSHVYANNKFPIKEDYKKDPASVYAASKYASEICCKAYSEQYGLDISVIRPFSVYGPVEAYHYVIPRIISKLKNDKIIELGNLQTKRDFIFISDLVNAIEPILKKANGFNVFNVGTGKAFSIDHICKILMKISGKEKKIKTKKSLIRKKDANIMIADCSRLQKLGWKPEIALEKGLKLTFYS